MATGRDPIRFTDVLTNASTVAALLGSTTVSAEHLQIALAVVTGEQSLEDLGPGVSPLVRTPGIDPTTTAAVRALVAGWYERLGSNPLAELDASQVERLRADIEAIRGREP